MVNAVSDRVRAELLRRIGLGDLLAPRISPGHMSNRDVPSKERASATSRVAGINLPYAS